MRHSSKKTACRYGVLVSALILGGAFLSGCSPGTTCGRGYPLDQAVYIEMRDGVRLAAEVWLPRDAAGGGRIPAVVEFTRYWRAAQYRLPVRSEPPLFNDYGYASVTVDVRGTGASFGQWEAPWSPAEVQDFYEVIDWIARRPWSDGTVAAFGVSYTGAAAQMAATTGHPALKAIVPAFTFYDIYGDVGFPGGAYNSGYVSFWSTMNGYLDGNDFRGLCDFFVERGLGNEKTFASAKVLVAGVKPVDNDTDGSLLAAAVDEHRGNVDLYDAYLGITYRDDAAGESGITVEDISVYPYAEALEDSGVAVFAWDGWHDGAGAHAALTRFATLGNPHRLIIGPWGHGISHHTSPYLPPDTESNMTWEELTDEVVTFLDRHMRPGGTGPTEASHILYYTLGEEAWKTADTWPPPGVAGRTWYFGGNAALTEQPPAAPDAEDRYTVDFEATTGDRSRYWLGGDVVYADRADQDRRLLTYTSEPLDRDVEITGHPVVTLYVSSTEADGVFYVYLEDIDAQGTVVCVSEGQLRALHRNVSDEQPPFAVFGPYHSFRQADGRPLVPGEIAELSFCLCPVSALIRKGHRIRVAVAGHDGSVFLPVPENAVPEIALQRNSRYPSHIVLPVMEGG